ncbi:conserved hypothetical protein [Gammaproteobacteria bacterium]
MAFPIKVDTGFPEKKWDAQEIVQDRINNLLYNAKKDDGITLTEPKLLTILIRKDKEHHFKFLKDETEFGVQGVWHDKSHKIFKEDNAEIQIQYLDNREGSVSKKLLDLFRQYNKNLVGEDVLYVTATPLDATSLNLEAGRDGK